MVLLLMLKNSRKRGSPTHVSVTVAIIVWPWFMALSSLLLPGFEWPFYWPFTVIAMLPNRPRSIEPPLVIDGTD